MKRLISVVLTILLIVALCNIFVACGDVFVKPDDNNQSNVGDNNDDNNNGSNNDDNNNGSNSGEDNGGNENPLIFTINFESNGGSEVASFTAEDGDIIIAPTIPTREGYTFVGWYIDKDLTKLWDFSKDVVSGTITLYAKWSADAGKIIAFENGLIDGSYIEVVVDEKTDSLAIEKSITLGGSGIWKLYYDIMGQVEIPTKIATQTNGKLNDGDNIFYIVSSTYDGSQVFTYKLNVHRQYMTTVDFMFNDETIKTVELLTKTVIPAYEVPKANAVTGYTISGWTQTVEEEEVDFVTATDKVQKATVLHSVHTANTYTVTLDADGGTVDKSTYTLTYDRSYSLNVPTKTGYTFEGWYYGSTRCTYDDGDSNGLWKIANDVTLTAKWQINEYKVTANKNISEAGNVSGGGYYDYQSMVTLTATTNKGYVWLGWYNDDTLLTVEQSYTFTMPSESVTYTAKFEECKHNYVNCVCTKCNYPNHHTVVDGTCVACGNALYSRSGNTLYFGSYPQTEVVDTDIRNTLNTFSGTLPTSSNSGLWTSYGYYINGSVSNFMWYIDLEQGGEKYRGVYFTSYRPYYTTTSSSSTYQDDNGYNTSTVYWFKYEPIKWTILTEDFKDATGNSTGGALILCDMIIDSQNYYITARGSTRTINGKTVYETNYEYSTIRSWLNDTFYNTAFNDLEKEIILTVTVDNSVSSTGDLTNSYACSNTQDKIFLPSYKEVTTYSLMDSSSERQKQGTDYAKAQGLYVYNSSGSSYNGNSYWWLRSPSSYYDHNARYVDGGGDVGNYRVYRTHLGVSPALVIRLA